MNAVAVDSAGNPSPVDRAKFWTIPPVLDFGFKVTDMADTADSEYTNNVRVRTVVTIPGAPDSVRFSENSAMAGALWMPYTEIGEFTLSNTINESKTVTVR
jgi:hypothetical protein